MQEGYWKVSHMVSIEALHIRRFWWIGPLTHSCLLRTCIYKSPWIISYASTPLYIHSQSSAHNKNIHAVLIWPSVGKSVVFRIHLSCLDYSLEVKTIICQTCTSHTARVCNLEPVLPQNSSGTNDFHDINSSWMPVFFCQCEKMVKYSDSVYCAVLNLQHHSIRNDELWAWNLNLISWKRKTCSEILKRHCIFLSHSPHCCT